MTPRILIVASTMTLLLPFAEVGASASAEGPVYQLRTYYTAPGKLPILLERFGTRNLPIFERHGIRLVGAWTPADSEDAERLVYLVAFPSREAADQAWAAFSADPEWKELFAAEKAEHGTVVDRVETVYLIPTGYGPSPEITQEGRHVYILRTYLTPPGKLASLNARFRDHTLALFQKHGLENVVYTTPAKGEKGADNTLIYFLRVPSREAAEASWTAFRNDPEWQRVKSASETDGSLTEKVESIDLQPTMFSPLR